MLCLPEADLLLCVTLCCELCGRQIVQAEVVIDASCCDAAVHCGHRPSTGETSDHLMMLMCGMFQYVVTDSPARCLLMRSCTH